MVIISGVGVLHRHAEHQNNPAVAAAHVYSPVGNMEGKEVRFGDTTSAMFNVSMTQTSDGAVTVQPIRSTPMAVRTLVGHDAREVTPGGTARGSIHFSLYAIIACSSAD